MEKPEKKRSPNYTHREKEILISLVDKYLKTIENKKTNLVFSKQKNECWEKLAWEYNSLQTTGLRTGQHFKSCYEQMKKIAKQHKAEDKVELLKTGGGTFIPKTTTLDDKILLLLKDNYFTIPNKFDNNKEPPVIPKSNFSGTYTESGNTETASNEENIYVLYEDDDPTQICEDPTRDYSVIMSDVDMADEDQTESITEPERKKTKIDHGGVQDAGKKVLKKQSRVDQITTKKLDVYNLKLKVLKTIAETELEHLKGAKLDNQIKEIIKEKEMVDLELKKKELNK